MSVVAPTDQPSTGHTAALPPRSWRVPVILAVLAGLTFVVFGLFGSDELVRFVWSGNREAIQLEPSTWSPRLVGLVGGVIALAAAGLALWFAWNRRKVTVWFSLVVGLAFLLALVAWVGAGGSVPVVFLLTGAIGLSTAIVFGALAGVIGERAGVVNIAIEAQLLGGAFTAAVVASTTGNYLLALIAAMVSGALVSMVLAAFSIKYLVDQVIVGVVLIGLVTAITNFFYSAVLSPNSGALNNPGTLPRIRIPLLADIPILGPVLFDQRITTYLMFILVPAVWFVLFKTKWGLRLRALGEHPLAADTVGINVNRWRFWSVTIAGLIAGLGGAALTIGSVGAFVREMSAGQGFIALAAVILGRWHPFYAALAALLFGFASNFRIWAGQAGSAIPSDLIAMTPYIVTILAVAVVAGRIVGPKAAGKPYLKE
ncbi:ABC transporter permease [Salinibacterium sp. ZJ70]|uniref:ABC transporter permease n=1 Tax=Salinibacterium sp. ZJ70 TaxID=2708084 RepID=UPI001423E0EA|nr:ABC transporter permease [Salinibacterium sp. ZJ70]